MARPAIKYQPGTFGAFVQAHGLENISDLKRGASVALMLSRQPQHIAPNSPMLGEIAKQLNCPVEDVAAFAKGKPMEDHWVRKVQAHLDNGTQAGTKRGTAHAKKGKVLGSVTVGGARGRRPGPGHAPTGSLMAFVQSVGKRHNIASFTDAASAARIPVMLLTHLAAGRMAPNHPAIERLAEALHVHERALARFCKSPAMSPGMIARCQKAIDKNAHRATGTAIVHVPKNGNGHHAVGRPKRAPTNRLRREERSLRETARALITSVNIGIMSGATHMPPLPLADLRLVLVDYLGAKGVRATVLVDTTFPDIFD